MKVKSTSGKGNFVIEKNDIEIVEVHYENWFSSVAKTTFEGQNIEIRPKNIWFSKFDIYKNGQDIGDIIFNWKGDMVLRLLNDANQEENFLLNAKGFWNSYFELKDEEEKVLYILRPSINWRKFSFDYDVENISTSLESKQTTEILIYSVFSANLYMTMMTSAVV